jgi:hypothetical protein
MIRGLWLWKLTVAKHNMNFLHLTIGGIGYNSYNLLFAAYFGWNSNDVTTKNMPINSDKNCLEWDLIPDISSTRINAAMVHLVNSKDGTLRSVNDKAV